MKRSPALLATVVLALVLTGCGAGKEPAAAPSAKPTPTRLPLLVRGSFVLQLPDFMWNPGVCAGRGGFDDINAGTDVVVTDSTSTTVAIGKLGTGQPVIDPSDSTRATSCLFTFDIKDAPSGRGFYGIEVGHRGRVQFPEAKLADRVLLELT